MILANATADTPKKTASSASVPQPFNLALGKATMSEAEEVWQQQGATVTSKGYADAKPSYSDNDPEGIANERAVLVDVNGLPLDRLKSARFGFFDNVLYIVKYEFEGGTDFDNLFRQVSSKYGRPQRQGGFGDKFYEWRFGQVLLSLNESFMDGHTLVFLHEPLIRNVKASNSQVYANHVKAKAKSQKGF